ncbi:MAG: hypothetical protein ACRDJI_01260 [Actinomycetota bacterium]
MTLVMSLAVLAVLVPATPASSTTCYIEEPGVDDVKCMLYGTPMAGPLCVKLHIC